METNFKLCWWMVIFACLSFIISIFLSKFILGFDLISRSGSLMVLFSAIGEYRLMLTHIPRIGVFVRNAHGKDIPSINPVNKIENRISIILHITLLLGTLIWGYGNLIF